MKTKRFQLVIFAMAILMSVLVSFAFEGMTNLAKNIPKDKRVIETIETINPDLDGAIIRDGEIVSTRKNAKIEFSSKYEKTLRITFKYKDKDTANIFLGNKLLEETGKESHFGDYDTRTYSFNTKTKNKQIKILLPQKGTTIESIEIDNRYVFNNYRFMYVLITCLVLIYIAARVVRKKDNVENAFLVLALILTLSMSTMLPLNVGASWDEHIHFTRVTQALPDKIEQSDFSLSNIGLNNTYDIANEKKNLDTINQLDGSTYDDFAQGSVGEISLLTLYHQIAYFPSAIIIFLIRLLGATASTTLIAGRLINGVLYSILIFFAIKRLKSGKVLMSVIALSPVAIFLASVYSYDWWVTAFAFLGSSYLIRELQEPAKEIEMKNLAIILGSFLVGFGPKAIYFPLVFGCLLFGKDKYKNKRIKLMATLAIITVGCLILATFALPMIIGGAGTGDARGGADVNSAKQIVFIFSHPVKYTKILLTFVASYIAPGSFVRLFSQLAYLNGQNDPLLQDLGGIMILTVAFAVISDRNETDNQLLIKKNRIWILLISFITICLVCTALYISFTPVALDTINGVQERYLIPLLFITLIMLGSNRIRCSFKKYIYNNVLLWIPTMVTILELGVLVIRKYY